MLESLENKSTRDGQRALIELGGPAALPRERERVLADDKSEIKFVMDKHLKDKLEEVRSLLGPEAMGMSSRTVFCGSKKRSLLRSILPRLWAVDRC